MTNFKVLSSAQIKFLNLALKEHNYIGKANTADGKFVKLYRFSVSCISNIDYTSYISEQEYSDLMSLDSKQYVFSPYFRILIRSLKDLVEAKKLTLTFKRHFYTEIPPRLGNFSHLSKEDYRELLIDLNNSFQDFRCRCCGHLMYMSSCDSYFEYYTCLNEPNCKFTLRVN